MFSPLSPMQLEHRRIITSSAPDGKETEKVEGTEEKLWEKEEEQVEGKVEEMVEYYKKEKEEKATGEILR